MGVIKVNGEPITETTRSEIVDALSIDASEVSFSQAGASAATRTGQAKMRDIVSPEDFTGTDTQKLQAALDTGKSVECTATSYTLTGTLTLKANGQQLNFNGALVTASGNFNLFEMTPNIVGAAIMGARINADNMTGGYVIYVSDADRLNFRDLVVLGPWNFCYVEKANVVELHNVWVNNVRGDYGIRWYGDATKRSDILRLFGVIISAPNSSAVGIDWDGDCHTLQAWGVGLVNCGKGLVIRNSSGGPPPALGFFTGLEIDFPDSYGIQIEAGSSYFFGPQLYVHGSDTASGIYVGTAVADNEVYIYGGKVTDHATYGIENTARVIVSDVQTSNNTLGDYSVPGDAYFLLNRLELDTQFFLRRTTGGDPVINFDTDDFDGYTRGTNKRFFKINAIDRMVLSNASDAVELYVNGALKQVTVGAADSGGTGFRVLRVPN